MFIYRVENLEALKARGGFFNSFTKIGYSPSFKGDRNIPRLYFFKDDIEKISKNGLFDTIEGYLENVAKNASIKNKFYPVRFEKLEGLKENLDDEWGIEISYYYEFDINEPHKIIIPIEKIEYWDKYCSSWKPLFNSL